MLLHESKNARVEWLPEEKAVFKAFTGFVHGDDLREAFKAGYYKMKDNRGSKWLSDNRGAANLQTGGY